METYYVYVLVDPRIAGGFNYADLHFLYKPFYVGKGKNKRVNAHFHNIKKSNNPYKTNKIKSILKHNFSKEDIIALRKI